MPKQKSIRLKMFVKEGCRACERAKRELTGLLQDLAEGIDVQIITTNPQIVRENQLMYAPTMRFNDDMNTQLVGQHITAEAILKNIRILKFKT